MSRYNFRSLMSAEMLYFLSLRWSRADVQQSVWLPIHLNIRFERSRKLMLRRLIDYLSISIYASNAHVSWCYVWLTFGSRDVTWRHVTSRDLHPLQDKEIYRYSFSEQKCGGQWKKAVYKISFYGLYSVNAQWYRYSVLGFDDGKLFNNGVVTLNNKDY